ncbi:hypothetical protein AK812_SmicGene8336 [Symbiodinium microadriaticum]|uniref:RNase H type-1 domain-containing protein n=1 Tax=Symbiodinium microadriaticum TaxID=2951 RepID=A0A1Q9EL42_SYMMI|nr:hypothetical protein AK812_SmicGene8336 [Symbiodinium microadriaticum]
MWAMSHSIVMDYDYTAPFTARWDALQLEYELLFDAIGVPFTPGANWRLEMAVETASELGPMWAGEKDSSKQASSTEGSVELAGLGTWARLPHSWHGDDHATSTELPGCLCTDVRSRVYSLPLHTTFQKGMQAYLNGLKRSMNRTFMHFPSAKSRPESTSLSLSQQVQLSRGASTAFDLPGYRPPISALAGASNVPFSASTASLSQRVQLSYGACTASVHCSLGEMYALATDRSTATSEGPFDNWAIPVSFNAIRRGATLDDVVAEVLGIVPISEMIMQALPLLELGPDYLRGSSAVQHANEELPVPDAAAAEDVDDDQVALLQVQSSADASGTISATLRQRQQTRQKMRQEAEAHLHGSGAQLQRVRSSGICNAPALPPPSCDLQSLQIQEMPALAPVAQPAPKSATDVPAVQVPPDRPDVSHPPALLWHHFRALDPKSGHTADNGLPPLIPAYLPAAARREQAAIDFSWGGIVGASNDAFAIFDVLRHATVCPRSPTATLQDIVAAAVSNAPFVVQAVQVLMTREQVRCHVQAVCPELPDLLASLLTQRLVAIDATGLMDDYMPDDLEEVQFITVERSARDWFTEATGVLTTWPTWAPLGPTSTSTTTQVQADGRRFRFVVLHGTAQAQVEVTAPCLQADAILESLLMDVFARNPPLRGDIHITMARAHPLPAHGVQDIVFLVCGDIDNPQATVVVDQSQCGFPRQTTVLAPYNRCEVEVPEPWRSRGFHLFANVAPVHLTQRPAVQGDYFCFSTDLDHPVSMLSSAILSALPILEPLAWPLVAGDRPFQQVGLGVQAMLLMCLTLQIAQLDLGYAAVNSGRWSPEGLSEQDRAARDALLQHAAANPFEPPTPAADDQSLLQTWARTSQSKTRQPRVSVPTPMGRRFLPPQASSVSHKDTITRPVLLCLDELAGPHHAQPAHGVDMCLRFPVPEDMPRYAFDRFSLHKAVLSLPEKISLHPQAASLLAGLPCVKDDRALDALCCFVDGSYKEQRTTWAVAYIGFQGGQLCWAGFRSGSLPSQYGCTSAFEGELFAQLVAYATIADSRLPAVVCYDAQAAASVAQLQTAKGVSSKLARAAGAVFAYVKAQGRLVQSMHTPSHKGCPGNELADSLARHALACPSNAADVHRSVHVDVESQAFDWVWLRAPGLPNVGYPDLDQHGDTISTMPSPSHLRLETPADFGPPVTEETTTVRKINGLMCTYNTLSSRTCLQRRCLTQFVQQHGIAFLALQETREYTQQVQRFGQILRISGPIQDPRLLVVLVTAGATRLALISAHAKTSTHSDEEIRQWWSDLSSRMLALPPNATPLVGIDANARFQWEDGTEKPCNLNGLCLDEFCQRFSLTRTAAYDADGRPRVTWRPPTGPGVCLDYLLCPADWSPHTRADSTMSLLDMHAGIDHDPLGLQLDVPLQAPSRRNMCVDRSAMLACDNQRRIQHFLAALPTFPWHMDVDDHLLLMQNRIRQGMQAMFPKNKVGPRKPTISQDTWNLLRMRRYHRRINRRKRQAHDRWLLYQCFRAWSSAEVRHEDILGLQDAVKARDLVAASHMRNMQAFSRQIKRASQADEANFSRQAIQSARVLAERLEEVVLPSMGGARAGIPLELAALTVQGHLEMLQRTNSAGAVLFIDGVSAFYATDRRLLFPRTPDALQAHLAGLPIEPAVADHFIAKASDRGAPLADIGFQYVILAALEALQEHMIAENLQVSIPLPDAQTSDALPVSWLDDLAILLQGDATSLVDQIARTACLVTQYLCIAGVEVNFAPGKSEILIHWAGKHSKSVREQVMVKDRARIRVPDFNGKARFIHCVSSYVHLGSLRDHKADMQDEIQRRAVLTREVYHPVRKRLIANPCFTRSERQGMFFSFILSRFLHGAGTWAFGDAASQAAYIRRYMSLA